jgi:hypothetical protein
MTGAGSVAAARSETLRTGGGVTPTSALHQLRVAPIPYRFAKEILVREHYLHSMPGGTYLAFGVFAEGRLLGALAFGVGPKNAHALVGGASSDSAMTLTRYWLNDELPPNSESRVLGIVLRALRRDTSLDFVLSYADPSVGHVGTIYQATGWIYTGMSQSMPLYDIGDGVRRHSRTLSHALGTHSMRHLRAHGIPIKALSQGRKHRYVYFLNPGRRSQLRVPEMPYPGRAVEQ